MAANTSASGGYLPPLASPKPLYDDPFEDFLHDVIAGITGVSGELIRPRWQPEPPNLPARDSNWLAFGVVRLQGDVYAVVRHREDDGGDDLSRHETVDVLVSAYGPRASEMLAILRDGLQIEQNREALIAAGVGFRDASEMIPAPVLVKDRWTRRWDMNVSVRREIKRTYGVVSLVKATAEIGNDLYQTDFIVPA